MREAEIRRLVIQSQLGEIVLQDSILKNPFTKKKKMAGGMAQGVGSKFKPRYSKKKKRILKC
jgi:hypothetical protein